MSGFLTKSSYMFYKVSWRSIVFLFARPYKLLVFGYFQAKGSFIEMVSVLSMKFLPRSNAKRKKCIIHNLIIFQGSIVKSF